MSNELIGKRKPGNGGSSWGENFYLKPGLNQKVDNIYRVLPPIHSLARLGKYAQYCAYHDGLRGAATGDSKGAYLPFLCPQEKKKKVITQHCPLCDRATELDAQLEEAKKRGASNDQLSDFRTKNVWPLQAKKKYFINVVNQENKIGTLEISYTMFQDLEARMNEWDAKGIDLTGQDAPFLNFTVTKKHKFDQDAIHKVDVYMQPQSDGSYRPITHSLTTEFVERLRTEAKDLTKLFPSLDMETVARLASADDATRAAIIDGLAEARKADKSEPDTDGPEQPVASSAAPSTPISQPVSQPVSQPASNQTAGDYLAGLTKPAAAAPVATPAPATAPMAQTFTPPAAQPKSSAVLSDAEFAQLFKPRQG